nr:transketolase C-terminal domain-containing protein [Clostridia bacterium]
YDKGEMFHEGGVPTEYYEIPIGDPDIKRVGKDVTILTVGATLYTALEAADELKEKYGMEAEVIDARTVSPFNYELVAESVKKTGRIVLASDACERGSHLKDMAATISELCFDYLDAPAVVVGSKNWITPAADYEKFFFPQPSWIIDAIHQKIVPLKGHTASVNYTEGETIRINKLGV